jgi:hypothetical protein
LARVIARYWSAGFSLEGNAKIPILEGGGLCRILEFVQTAPMTARRHLD